MTLHMGLVVARPSLVRDGLHAVLSAVPGMQALEPADRAGSALERLENHALCLVILDSSLPEEDLCTTLAIIKERWPQVWCIVIADNRRQSRVMEAAGADAVLVEGFSPALLSEMIKEVIEAAGSATTDAQDKPNPENTGTENTV